MYSHRSGTDGGILFRTGIGIATHSGIVIGIHIGTGTGSGTRIRIVQFEFYSDGNLVYLDIVRSAFSHCQCGFQSSFIQFPFGLNQFPFIFELSLYTDPSPVIFDNFSLIFDSTSFICNCFSAVLYCPILPCPVPSCI